MYLEMVMGSRGRWLQECLKLLGEHPCSSVSYDTWIQSERRGEWCQQGIEVSIFDFLDCPTDDEQVTVLTPLDYNNILFTAWLMNQTKLPTPHVRETREGRSAVKTPVLDWDVSSVLRHAILRSTALDKVASHDLVNESTSLLITDLAQTVPENQIVKSLSRCFPMTFIEYRCPCSQHLFCAIRVTDTDQVPPICFAEDVRIG